MRAKNVRKVLLAMALIASASLVARQACAASTQLTEGRRCRKAITTQGATYAKKRQGLLLMCVDKLLKCAILAEVDGSNQGSCRSLAEAWCNDHLGTASTTALSKVQAVFDAKTAASCVVFGLSSAQSTAAGGLWFANDTDCGSSPDLPTLVQCLRGKVEQQVDGIVGQVKPRAGILLTNMGLGDEFPNVPLPPTMTVVISATAPNSGVLQNPGTITVPAGTALRIEGDPGLACSGGGGSNGHLDVTVGGQQVQLKEPWGPTEFALLGPYTASGTLGYTITLKDAMCMDTTTGNVSVP